ncbi:MAG: efflux RND transporter periplasmic adaptor subunit [Thiohalomonadaceae bacterium]
MTRTTTPLTAMNRTLRRLFVISLPLLAAIAAGWYATRPKPVAVVVSEVQTGLVEATVANTRAGTVKACRRARLAPPQGGQVAELLVRKGDRVEAQQLLLRLWNDDLAAQVALARSEAQAASARADEACLMAEVAQREARRTNALHKQNLVSDEQRDRNETDAQARAAACTAARASARVANDRVRLNEALLERTLLRAPFAGMVAETTGEVGEFVTPSPPGIPTPPAVDLVDNSCLYVVAPIDEIDAPRVRLGMPARILLDAFGNRPFAGHVARIAPYVLDVEKQARTVEMEVEFDDPQDITKLLAGYSADAEIILERRENVLRIPTEALLEGNRVLLFDGDLLHERKIETGIANWQYTEVVSGLAAGARVVTSIDRAGVRAGVHAVVEDATGKAK